VPAAIAGYHAAALGFAHIGIPTEGWRQAIALIGAIVMKACMMLSCPAPDARQRVAAAVMSLDPLTWMPRQG
jgi:hypothetical protein